MIQLLNAIFSGLALAMPLFLAASGLTLIYGVMHIVNFAHGGFFMVGAYVVVMVLGGQASSFPLFLMAVVVAGLVVAVLSIAAEQFIFRWLDAKQHLITLLASYALSLCIAGAANGIWGTAAKTQRPPELLTGTWNIGGVIIARNDVFLVIAGLVIAGALWFLMNRTAFGKQAVAVAGDPVMAKALGIRVRRISVGVFAVGGLLAGLAGGLASTQYSIGPGLDQLLVLECFAVVIVGGLGSVAGAFQAAIVLGLMQSIVASYAPALSGYALYIAMAVVLMLRPQGLALTFRVPLKRRELVA